VKNVLNGNLKLWQLLVLGVVVSVLFGGAAVALADPGSVNNFFTQGTVRMASAYSSNSVDINAVSPEKLVLSTTIVIPDGKKAELQTTFSADMHPFPTSSSYAYCFGHFGLDNANPDSGFKPGGGSSPNYLMQLIGGAVSKEPDAFTVTMIGFRKGVSAGTHTVNVYVSSAYNGCEIQASNLNVIANIH
jgi:hypothetical protein